MEKLTLRQLLHFLSKYKDWTLKHKDGFYSLHFFDPRVLKRRRRKLSVVTSSTTTRHQLQMQLLRQRRRPLRSFQRRSRLKNRTALSEGDDDGDDDDDIDEKTLTVDYLKDACKKKRHHHESYDTLDSCDSLIWDNYDVEKAKTPVPTDEDPGEDSEFSLNDSDFSFQCGQSAKDSSPDNMREGKRLLKEMKELRQEIKKIGDVSTLNISAGKEIESKIASIKEEDTAATAAAALVTSYDSGYSEETFSHSEQNVDMTKGSSKEKDEVALLNDEGSRKEEEETLLNGKGPSKEEEETLLNGKGTSKGEDKALLNGHDQFNGVQEEEDSFQEVDTKIENKPTKQLKWSKSQKKREKRKKASLEKDNKEQDSSKKEHVDPKPKTPFNCKYQLPPGFKEQISQKDDPFADILAQVLGIKTEINENSAVAVILRKIIENTSPDLHRPHYQRVVYRDMFEWEICFCETHDRFEKLLQEKHQTALECLKTIVPWKLCEKSHHSYKKPHRSIMCL